MRQSIYKRFSHNIYIVSIYRAFRNLTQTEQTDQTKQNEQDRLFEIAGDILGAISLFIIFYAAIVLAGIFQ
ncbi:MAG: hypothetical protein CMA66_00850 [Euryarchaeota archaeon]|jgi:hypothetical protein|nr:hypothetical protein [Euryarchaeota archaeon]|tara:strand:- start:245 stop:457 length:213 start_codon:yes stop_codon:yes gene_type:complete